MQEAELYNRWQARTNQLIGAASVEADLVLRGVVYGTNSR